MSHRRIFYCFIIALFAVAATGCSSLSPSVLTESRDGSPLTRVDIPAQGDRAEIPTGVDAGDIVAQVHTDSGSTIVIAVNKNRSILDRVMGKHKYAAYLDNKAVSESQAVATLGEELITQPKAPWWKWPAIILISLACMALVYFARPLLDMLREVIKLVGRFRK